MRFRYKKYRRNLESQMNVVPYIDVMLVLLIIFMVTAPMFVPGVINLPSVGKASHINNQPLQIIVKSDDNYQISYNNIENNFVNIISLVSYAQSMIQKNPDLAIVISADKNIAYDKVINVVNKLYMANIKKVALVVKENSI
jgi:biopolymer transport protein TolR